MSVIEFRIGFIPTLDELLIEQRMYIFIFIYVTGFVCSTSAEFTFDGMAVVMVSKVLIVFVFMCILTLINVFNDQLCIFL